MSVQVQFNNPQVRSAREGAVQTCKRGFQVEKPPRNEQMDRAAAAVLQARGVPLSARRVRGFVNAIRLMMERRSRGLYEAVSLACVMTFYGNPPRWLR